MLEKNRKKVKNFFSVKWLVMHPRWSRVVPNHFPDPKECFWTTLHPIWVSISFAKESMKPFVKLMKRQSQDYVIPIQFFVELHLSKSTWMNCDIWKKFRNLFWGSGKWFGTTLDHLGCITSHFTEKNFLTFFRFFSSIFQSNFANFWRIWAVQIAKNRFFQK